MYTLLIVITLTLLPNNTVIRTIKEIHLPGGADCLAVLDEMERQYEGDTDNTKLLSIGCVTRGSM